MGLDIYFTKRKDTELHYFRKVNFLVYFFKQINPYIENRGFCFVNKEHIEDLLDRCNKVLIDHEKAEELLPTMDGFFYGSTDYDEHYFKKVIDVAICCDKLLKEFPKLTDDERIIFEIDY